MVRILVTGGAGYIGSHAVKVFLNRGCDVAIIDNLSTGHIEAADKRAYLYHTDIRNKSAVKEVLGREKPDAVVHFAANSLVGESMSSPLLYFNNNVYGMQMLLEAMLEEGIDKIVFSSSAATYGDQKTMPLTEESPTIPTNPYGETKLFMEKMMKWCDSAYGIKYVSLRYFNAAGACEDGSIGEDHSPETHLIPIVLQVPLRQRENVVIYGNDYDTPDGTCIRDYIHVIDLADAHFRSVEYLLGGGKSEIFNLGSGMGQSVSEIIKTAEEVIGRNIKTSCGARREGDPSRLIASNKKVREALGWSPAYSLADIVSSAWNFHQKHPEGFASTRRHIKTV